MLNKRERERYEEIQRELNCRARKELKQKEKILNKKMSKADVIAQKQVNYH